MKKVIALLVLSLILTSQVFAATANTYNKSMYTNRKPKDITPILNKNIELPKNVKETLENAKNNVSALDNQLKTPFSSIISTMFGTNEGKIVQEKFDEILKNEKKDKYKEIYNLISEYDSKIKANRANIVSNLRKLSNEDIQKAKENINALNNLLSEYKKETSTVEATEGTYMNLNISTLKYSDIITILGNNAKEIYYYRTKQIFNFISDAKSVIGY